MASSGQQPAGQGAWTPTHQSPQTGMPAWASPDPRAAPVAALDPWLQVQLLERSGDWGHVLCSNGWSAWVDVRLLLPLPGIPASAATAGASGHGAPAIAAQPVLEVTAALRGMAIWGWPTNFTVRDQSGNQVASGSGLGRRGQIAG